MRTELELALGGSARVIPVLVGGSAFPDPETLTADLAPLITRNAVYLSDERWQTDVERLIDAIEYSLASREPSSEALQRSGAK